MLLFAAWWGNNMPQTVISSLSGLMLLAGVLLFAPSFVEAAESAGDVSQGNGLAVRTLPPLADLVTSPFSMRGGASVSRGRRSFRREHHGVDIKGRIGWPVIALRGGEVLQAGPSGPGGIVAKVRQDDGMTVVYAHLDKIFVTMGQTVSKGETIGHVGCTGRTTGSHLHLAMRNAKGDLVDPLNYVKRSEDVFKPEPEQIPAKIDAEACRRTFFYRGRMGGRSSLGALDNYQPPEIPVWRGGR